MLRYRFMLAGILFQIIFSRALLCLPPLQWVLGTSHVSGEACLTAWLGIPFIFGADDLSKRLSQPGRSLILSPLIPGMF
jgi:sodium/potassium-transporting ATPase subunit alpha